MYAYPLDEQLVQDLGFVSQNASLGMHGGDADQPPARIPHSILFSSPSADSSGNQLNSTSGFIVQRYDARVVSQTPLDRYTTTARYEVDVPGFQARPYIFQVAASNNAGQGPMSHPSAIVFEACASNQFLATHKAATEPEKAVCVGCPDGAFCGGLPSENVTAQAGAWRVPWSSEGLLFENCPEPTVCQGTPTDIDAILDAFGGTSDGENTPAEAQPDASNSTSGRRLGARSLTGDWPEDAATRSLQGIPPAVESLRQFGGRRGNYSEAALVEALLATLQQHSTDLEVFRIQEHMSRHSVDLTRMPYPTLVLDPDEQEGCTEGNFGTLCTQCQLNYARSGTFQCRRCADRRYIIALAVIAFCVLIGAIGFVIRGTLMTR